MEPPSVQMLNLIRQAPWMVAVIHPPQEGPLKLGIILSPAPWIAVRVVAERQDVPPMDVLILSKLTCSGFWDVLLVCPGPNPTPNCVDSKCPGQADTP